MSQRKRIAGIDNAMIKNLKEISFFVILVLSTMLCITSIAYFQNQFDSSPTMVLYKEIAEDCYPSAICDREGTIHVVWQSNRKGNWDIYYTSLGASAHEKELAALTKAPEDESFPSVAEDEKGDIWAVWARSGPDGSSIWGKILETQKSSWSEKVELISTDGSKMKSPSLISIDSTRMLLVWISRKGETQEIRYSVHKNSENQMKLLFSTNNSRKVLLGKTKTGKIFALWDSMSMGKSYLHVSLFDEENETFTEHYLLTSVTGEPFVGDTPSVAIRSEGPSILFFRKENWDIQCSIESMEENGTEFPVFSQPTVFCETGALEDCPSAVAHKGDVYLFWTSDYTRDYEIFFCHSPNVNDFKERKLQYERGPTSVDEDLNRFVRNLTMDSSQNNSNPYGYFCDDIFFSTAVVGEELWVTWDSYQWDLVEMNNRRKIKYVKTSDGYNWSTPITVIDSSKSNKSGRDERNPAIAEAKDRVWLFWHSDRYRTGNDDNFEICYIYSEDGGKSWIWREPDEDPFLLTRDPGRDMCPSVSSINDRIFVVWRSDRRFGDFDIFFCEFDGKDWLSVQCIASREGPEWNPSITAYRGWHLSSLGYAEDLTVAWESIKEGRRVCYFSTVNFVRDTPHIKDLHLEKQRNTDVRFPSASLISKHKILSKILRNDLWLVWQCGEIGRGKSNIWYKNENNDGIPVTDNFSRNERPQIIEFDEKIWIFWDSNGGGNERGIYYKYMSRKDIPFWLSIYSYVLAVCWALFFLDIRSKGDVRKFILELGNWVDNLFYRHVGLRDVIIGVAASLLAYILLHFLGTFLGYLS
ncbi:MAG: sialidase family protein [Candidatus Methanofastidiosia archaeon]|jgi:hypothetical protein